VTPALPWRNDQSAAHAKFYTFLYIVPPNEQGASQCQLAQRAVVDGLAEHDAIRARKPHLARPVRGHRPGHCGGRAALLHLRKAHAVARRQRQQRSSQRHAEHSALPDADVEHAVARGRSPDARRAIVGARGNEQRASGVKREVGNGADVAELGECALAVVRPELHVTQQPAFCVTRVGVCTSVASGAWGEGKGEPQANRSRDTARHRVSLRPARR